MRRCAAASTRSHGARRPRARASASRSRRRARRGGCGRRSACPRARACSCTRSNRRSPAAAAGLQRGDLIVAAQGRPLHGYDDLFDALEAGAGELALSIVRGTEERELSAHFS